MPHHSSPKPWRVRVELHIRDPAPPHASAFSHHSSHHSSPIRLLFAEEITLPPLPAIAPNRADISLSDLDTVLLTNLRVALLRPRRRATMTELRRLNGLSVKGIWAWWNYDTREVASRGSAGGRRVKRMTEIVERNIGEVLNGVRLGGGSNCLVVYAELPRVVRGMGMPGGR